MRAGRLISPTLAVALSTLFWGTAWYPMRALQERGLDPDWAVAVMFGALTLVLAPLIWRGRARLSGHWRALGWIGLTGGVAMTCYYLGVTLTTVARATLLFYLAPAWTTLIEFLALRRPIGLTRGFELALGLAGLLVILGPGGGEGGGVNLGDLFAFGAGALFALSSFLIHRHPAPGAVAFTWAWAVGSALSAWLAGALYNPEGLERALAAANSLTATFLPAAALGTLLFLPMNLLTLWGAARLTPTRLMLLLMCEVGIAFASSAILADDPFGPREFFGCALILSATLVEPLRQRLAPPARHAG